MSHRCSAASSPPSDDPRRIAGARPSDEAVQPPLIDGATGEDAGIVLVSRSRRRAPSVGTRSIRCVPTERCVDPEIAPTPYEQPPSTSHGTALIPPTNSTVTRSRRRTPSRPRPAPGRARRRGRRRCRRRADRGAAARPLDPLRPSVAHDMAEESPSRFTHRHRDPPIAVPEKGQPAATGAVWPTRETGPDPGGRRGVHASALSVDRTLAVSHPRSRASCTAIVVGPCPGRAARASSRVPTL